MTLSGADAMGSGGFSFAPDSSAYAPTANAILVLPAGENFANTVSGFGPHDAIGLQGVGFETAATLNPSDGEITLTGGDAPVALAFAPRRRLPPRYPPTTS